MQPNLGLPQPTLRNIVGNQWAYKINRKADGNIKRFKARLVAKGYTQEYGLDFTNSFNSIVKSMRIRTFLTVAFSRRWKLC